MAENKENLQEEVIEEAEPTAEEKLEAELNETKDKLMSKMGYSQ